MADTTIKEEILNEIDKMTPERQKRVLDFARMLLDQANKDSSGKGILSLAGSMTSEEAEEMTRIIEEDKS